MQIKICWKTVHVLTTVDSMPSISRGCYKSAGPLGLLASCPNAPKSFTWLDWSLDPMELLNIVPAKQALFLCWLIFLIGGHEGTWLEVQPIRNVRQSCYILKLHESCTRHILVATRREPEKTQNYFIIHWCSIMFIYSRLFNIINVFIPMFFSQQSYSPYALPLDQNSNPLRWSIPSSCRGRDKSPVGMRGLQDTWSILRIENLIKDI